MRIVLFGLDDNWTAGIVTVATLSGGGIVWLFNWLNNKQRTTLSEYQEIVGRLQKTVDQQQSTIDELQRAMNRMVVLYADSRAEVQELYAIMAIYHGMLKRQSAALTKVNIACEDVPDLPPKPNRQRDNEVEYLQRSTQQNTNVTKKASHESQQAG